MGPDSSNEELQQRASDELGGEPATSSSWRSAGDVQDEAQLQAASAGAGTGVGATAKKGAGQAGSRGGARRLKAG